MWENLRNKRKLSKPLLRASFVGIGFKNHSRRQIWIDKESFTQEVKEKSNQTKEENFGGKWNPKTINRKALCWPLLALSAGATTPN